MVRQLDVEVPSSVNSMNAKRRIDLLSPQIRQSTTFDLNTKMDKKTYETFEFKAYKTKWLEDYLKYLATKKKERGKLLLGSLQKDKQRGHFAYIFLSDYF